MLLSYHALLSVSLCMRLWLLSYILLVLKLTLLAIRPNFPPPPLDHSLTEIRQKRMSKAEIGAELPHLRNTYAPHFSSHADQRKTQAREPRIRKEIADKELK